MYVSLLNVIDYLIPRKKCLQFTTITNVFVEIFHVYLPTYSLNLLNIIKQFN